MGDFAALLCILSLLLVLGGGVAIVLYGVKGLAAMARGWVDRK
jgi:hypothetical protein